MWSWLISKNIIMGKMKFSRLIKLDGKGQSLVEVIIACGILSVIMAAMMSIVISSRNLLYQSVDQTRATTLAQEGMEIAMHQRDVGCSFANITDASGSLISTTFIIKGDTVGSNDETIQTTGTPNNIPNASGFWRYIIIEEMTGNHSDIDLTSFNTNVLQCSDPTQDYDCPIKYYAVRVDIHKGSGSGPIVSRARTIISK